MTEIPTITHAFITGGAGFIGSHLADRLLDASVRVTVYDKLVTGFTEFLDGARRRPGFTFIEGDVLDQATLTRAMSDADIVFHLAANADVRFGIDHPGRDLEQNTIGTFTVLEAMRANRVRRIVFSSTGSVYGDALRVPTPEDAPFPIQTSLYGASKLAGEGLISAYGEGFGFQGLIFRFVSILGERYTHGHIFDFYRRLLEDPTTLPVLGDGSQRKSYLHVQDCIDAMLTVVASGGGSGTTIFNLGTDEYVTVNDSIDTITAHLGVNPRRVYSGGNRGWIGDSPFIFLDTCKIRALGWTPKLTIRQGIIRTLEWLRINPFVYDRRS